MHRTTHLQRGVSLIDTVVGIGLMVLVFSAITGVFMLSVDVVTNNKARIGALSLANEEMEYMRSLPYDSVGTVGGIPAGSIPQDESISLNDIDYTRHVLVQYVDLPQDGTGANDTNGITADVKSVKVSVSWTTKGVTRSLAIDTTFAPAGIESAVPGGTIAVTVTNSAAVPLPGASVRIVNASTSPAIDVTTTSDSSGMVTFIGAPAASGYQVTVSEPGYSTAKTYSATAALPNPSPGNLTVALGKTTGATFAIDTVGTFAISSYKQIYTTAWQDLFSDTTHIATSTNIDVAGGSASLSASAVSGEIVSESIQPAYLYGWRDVSWTDATSTGNTILYHVYAGNAIVPDAALPGNAAGFSASPVDISMLATSTYPLLDLHANFTGDGSSTPSLLDWQVSYDEGPEPLPNIPFSIRGAKTIGTDGAGGTVYKYDTTGTTGTVALVTLTNMEWDTYTLSVASATGYDVAESCMPSPNALAPGQNLSTSIYLAPHTANSILVDVRSNTGAVIPGAAVVLSRSPFSSSIATDSCGQSFFSGLAAGTAATNDAYAIQVTAAGYQAYSATNVDVSGASRLSVILTP